MALIANQIPCLYCLSVDTPKSEEHVLQQSFGTNLVLKNDVCADCNTKLFSAADKSFVDFAKRLLADKAKPTWIYQQNLGIVLDMRGRWITVRMNEKMEATILPQIILKENDGFDFVIGERDGNKQDQLRMIDELKSPDKISFSICTINPRSDTDPPIQTSIIRTSPYTYQIRAESTEIAEQALKRIKDGYFKKEVKFGETKNFGNIEKPELNGHVSVDFVSIQRAAIKAIINTICAINPSAARHKTLDKLRSYARSGKDDSDLVLVDVREKVPEQLELFLNKHVHSITIASLQPKALALISLYGKPFSYQIFDPELSGHLAENVGVKSIAFNFNDRTSRIFDLMTEFPDFHQFGAQN